MKKLYLLLFSMILLSSCDQEKCALCQVIGKPEIYIQPVCGDDEFINGHINFQERKYSPDKVKCVIQ